MRFVLALGFLSASACVGDGSSDDPTNSPTTGDTATNEPSTSTTPIEPDPTGIWQGDCAWIEGAVGKYKQTYYTPSVRLAFTEDAGDVAAFGMLRLSIVGYPDYYQDVPLAGTGSWDGVDAVSVDFDGDGVMLAMDGVVDGVELEATMALPLDEQDKKSEKIEFVDAMDCTLVLAE